MKAMFLNLLLLRYYLEILITDLQIRSRERLRVPGFSTVKSRCAGVRQRHFGVTQEPLSFQNENLSGYLTSQYTRNKLQILLHCIGIVRIFQIEGHKFIRYLNYSVPPSLNKVYYQRLEDYAQLQFYYLQNENFSTLEIKYKKKKKKLIK